jgi:hypothetical protein
MFGLDPSQDQIRNMAEQVDISDDEVQEALLKVGEDKIRPQLEEIKERAGQTEDVDEIRSKLAEMDDEQIDAVFHETWAEFITACVQLRIEPLEGMRNLKTMIRDPWTIEIMLLLMEDDEIPTEISKANKDLITQYVTWIGRALAPEMYEREHIEAMVEEFGADPELLDKWDESHLPDDVSSPHD